MSRAVIDQPGFRVGIIGLVLSVFLGLALRSQISDARIQGYLDKAVSRLQADFVVDYEYAKVNLSKWGMPFPVLEVQRIRLSPKSSVCQNSQIYIDELEVPISVSLLLGLTDKIPKIRLQEMELRFSDSSEKCIFQSKKIVPERPLAPASPPTPTIPAQEANAEQAKTVFSKSTRAELKEVYIEKLRVIYAKKPEQPLLLKQVGIDLKYNEHKLSDVTIKSKLNAFKDSRADIYFLNGNLTLQIRAKSEKDIDSVVSMEGKLLDGDVQFFAHNVSGEQKVAYEVAVDKVSGKALLPFLEPDLQQKIGLLDRIPNSFSFSNNGEIFMGGDPSFSSQFRKVVINIDSAQVRSNDVSFNLNKGKWQIAPFEMDLEAVPLSKLKQSDNLRGRLDSFESLGSITGKLSFKDESHYQFNGQLLNLEAVFSNRGRRDLQRVDEINLHLAREQQNVLLTAKDFVINSKRLPSSLNIQHNLGDNSTQAQFKITGLSLNKKIWEQFTFVEQSPLLDFNWVYKKTKNEVHNIKLTADSLEIPGFKFDNLTVDLAQVVSREPNENSLRATMHPLKAMSTPKLLENEYVNKLVAGSIRIKNRLFSSDKTTIVLNGRNWLNLSFDLESNLSDIESKSLTNVSFKGTTSQRDGLSSKILLTSKGTKYLFDFYTTPDSRLILDPVK